MGVLVIKCIETGRAFSTGVHADPQSFALMPNTASFARCPHCRCDHAWRPLDAKLVAELPSVDWIEN